MKKWSTLIYIVKKITKQKINDDHVLQNFLTITEEEAPFSPSADSLRNIMDFAKSYEVLNSDSAGHIELLTN
ncbi:MAG TPA: hypothetical protein VFD91_03470 [Mariniphaga sp.]|nr:hypothetical protein [Mariniphaga sp.]